MSAVIVEIAGILKLKQYHMENIKIKLYFDYPKRRDGFTGRENRRYWLINTKTKFPRGIEAGLSVEVSEASSEISLTSNCLESDQAISPKAATAAVGVRPGPGLKLQASSDKPQAASKPEPVQVQASSAKRQASQPE